MTRKDTILIAVIINAGLLAILFTTAIIYDTDKRVDQAEFVTPLVDAKVSQSESPALIAAVSTGDEVDNVLKYYSQPSSQQFLVDTQPEIEIPETNMLQTQMPDDAEFIKEVAQESVSIDQGNFIEVTVKKGDVLEKIAKDHKTSIAAIKKANNLRSERLSIGQILKIPKKTTLSNANTDSASKKHEPSKRPIPTVEPIYYVVKNGDNPWKIAKQFNVKYEDILSLNHMDENKARNLKVGDRIRVK